MFLSILANLINNCTNCEIRYYLGGDIRLIYEIDEEKMEIVVFSAGSHKVY